MESAKNREEEDGVCLLFFLQKNSYKRCSNKRGRQRALRGRVQGRQTGGRAGAGGRPI